MEERELYDSQYSEWQDGGETKIRPLFLKDFQGQDELKKNLTIYIQAARQRGEPLDHLFLSGPPGLGKTTLANIVANEMGAEIKMTGAPVLEKPKDLAGMLTALEPGSVFFIDEIHRLKPVIEEMLYTAMEDFEIDWVIGQGAAARSIRVPVAPFTLIGATTKSGSVSAPLYSRFGIDLSLSLYDNRDLRKVIERTSRILHIDIEESAVEKLAACSRGTPRIANRLLKRIRDFAEVEGNGTVTDELLSDALARLNIDGCGLGRQDRKILETIVSVYNGGPVGAETLSIHLGEPPESLEDFYEPFLIRKGFLQRTPRGRIVTDAGYAHLGYAPRSKGKENEDGRFLF